MKQYLATIQIVFQAPELQAADDAAQATVRWAEGFYAADGDVMSIEEVERVG